MSSRPTNIFKGVNLRERLKLPSPDPALAHDKFADVDNRWRTTYTSWLERQVEDSLGPLVKSTDVLRASLLPGVNHKPPTKPNLFKTLPQEPRSKQSGWKITATWGCGLAVSVPVLNIALLCQSHSKPRSASNNIVLFSGNCDQSKKFGTISHLFINILSTLLLGASNYSIQVLCAPTREDVDDAHSRGKSVRYAVVAIQLISRQCPGYRCQQFWKLAIHERETKNILDFPDTIYGSAAPPVCTAHILDVEIS